MTSNIFDPICEAPKAYNLPLYHSRLQLMKSGDVESNPGPMNIITYNVRGLKLYDKLKRLLNKCYKII